MSRSLLLVKNGFISSKYADLYKGKSPKDIEKIAKEEHADEEVWEEVENQYLKTGYPWPLKRYRVSWEAPNLSMEESYFWILNYVSTDIAYPHTIKTIDAFSASENSAFFGVSQQRIGLQQDKVSQFLATVGKMVKEIFQLVRELRIIDERREYYEEAMVGKESAEITLKGIWVDMVEGGAKNPASVFGMAREVQFTSLPDLFFSTQPRTSEEVDDYVERTRGGFNVSVKNALKRKLKMFLIWKEKTFEELKTRRSFTLKYLRQHYTIIKMYMTWVKPYLKHVRRLTLDEDRVLTPQMVSAFEGSMVEVEFLAHKEPMGRWYPCLLCSFLFRTRPSMSFQQEGYQRGPIHVGKLDMDFRAYVWTKEQIDNFKNLRDKEDLELIKSVSGTLAEAIDSMGGELEAYLEEAEGKEKEEERKGPPTMLKRFRTEFLGPKKEKGPKKPKRPKLNVIKDKSDKGKASKTVLTTSFWLFKNYKKGHGMIMW
ncbi:MAG: hypothetical protein V3V78_00675 [Candidatus Woesearchaeota archaeon]